MFRRLLVSLGLFSFSSNAFATHSVVCSGQQSIGEIEHASLTWLAGSLGMVGPVELTLQGAEFGERTIHYTVSPNYEGTRLEKVGYFLDDQDIRMQLMDEEFVDTVILFKFDRSADGTETGTGRATIHDLANGVSTDLLTFDKCEVL